ncbi:MAG: hypothetical protein AB7O43_10185 [Hyphomicrobiaceae bacterium]
MSIARQVRRMLTAAAVLSVAFCPAAYTQANKPKLSPGRDPGGTAVAVIGGGIDYTNPEISSRLARDGEGELVGWDFLDGDRRPFNRCPAAAKSPTPCPADIARTILREAETSALVVARASADRPQSVAQALAMVAQTRAGIALLALADDNSSLAGSFITEAARRFPALLLIVPVHGRGFTSAAGNVLTVASADAPKPAGTANLAVPSRVHARAAGSASPADLAALAGARVTALAARMTAVNAGIDAARLKQAILQLAAPTTANSGSRTTIPVIERPDQPLVGR